MTDESLEIIKGESSLTVDWSPGNERKKSGVAFDLTYQIEDAATHEWVATISITARVDSENAHLSIAELETLSLTRVNHLLSLTAKRIS